jgi:TPR repeat protein
MRALADFGAAQRAFDKGDYATALNELLPLAKQGNPEAQFYLGFMYEYGRGVPQDSKEAIKWFRLAADQGNSNSQFYIGVKYILGRGVPQDYKEAAKWYGYGVPQDHKEAIKWYRLAAGHGLSNARFNLGFMYEYGRGVPQDYVQAHMWYNLAAVTGDATSFKNRDLLAEKMTPMQIAEAQRLAREQWIKDAGHN